MKYIDFTLNCGVYSNYMEMYGDLEHDDIVTAVYRVVNGETHNPDICALPPSTTGHDLIKSSIKTMPGYDREEIPRMKKSQRIHSLRCLKDMVRVFLFYQDELEKRFQECLVSAYLFRKYGSSNPIDGQKEILSIAEPIGASVQDMSVIGTAGTGKSSAVNLLLSRYPRVIRHNLDGFIYTQIPCLSCTVKSDDIKSIFTSLADRIDTLLDTKGYYKSQMQKNKTVSSMESYLCTLIRIFHVGIVVLDEIQLISKVRGKSFDHILSLTAESGVSVMIIGTEKAIETMQNSEWFVRRFAHLGRVCTDAPPDRPECIHSIIKQLWQYQWTLKEFPLTKSVLSTLSEISNGNIDFLTTVYIAAQLLVIKSEGTDNELKLNAKTIAEAAKLFPRSRELIKGGAKELMEAYCFEKDKAIEALKQAEYIESLKENKNLIESASSIIQEEQDVENSLVNALCYFGYDKKKIIKKYRYLSATDSEFSRLDRKQQAKTIAAIFMKEEEEKKQKKTVKKNSANTSNKTKTNDKSELNNTDFFKEGSHGLEQLSTALSG